MELPVDLGVSRGDPAVRDEATAPRGASVAYRDCLGAAMAARRRPMSERLELALSWNAVAAELRVGLGAVAKASRARR